MKRLSSRRKRLPLSLFFFALVVPSAWSFLMPVSRVPAVRSHSVRCRQSLFSEGQEGKSVEDLLRQRKLEKLEGTGADAYVTDDDPEEPREGAGPKVELPDLKTYMESGNRPRPARDVMSGEKPAAGGGGEQQDESTGVRSFVRQLRRISTEPPRSSDRFDSSWGRIVKESVYYCCGFLVLWELYINSPFFERAGTPPPFVF